MGEIPQRSTPRVTDISTFREYGWNFGVREVSFTLALTPLHPTQECFKRLDSLVIVYYKGYQYIWLCKVIIKCIGMSYSEKHSK